MTPSTATPLHHLLVPDGTALLGPGACPAGPATLAASLGVGLAGLGAFGGVLLLADATTGAPVGADGAPAVLAGVLMAGLLTFPPLYLVSALRKRPSTVQHLLAVAAVGPAVAGTWLLATAPVLLLYALTGAVGPAFVLLALGLLGAALLAGGRAALLRAREAGPVGPGVLIVLVHYLLTGWTALVLSLHLS